MKGLKSLRLFIAEKEKVADQIARQYPGATKKRHYYEYPGGYIAWAQGHLFRDSTPGEYNPEWENWRLETLPMLPEQKKLILDTTFGRGNLYNKIKELASLSEVTEIVNAGDPDREGQLLIHEILNDIGNRKKVLRYDNGNPDSHSVKKALENLEDDSNPKYVGMGNSAYARSRLDWYRGMNDSRLFTLLSQKAGHDFTFHIGRVKTPLMCLICRREEEIKKFVKTTHYGLQGMFKKSNDEFKATWQPLEEQVGLNNEGLMVDKAILDKKIVELRSQVEGTVTVCETEEKKEAPKKMYSLTALQKEAGRYYKYSPSQVLDIAQYLYENEFTTYPRSDSQFLPEAQFQDAPDIIKSLQQADNFEIKRWAEKADISIKSKAWDDKGVTAHHAIIPTRTICPENSLTTEQRNIYLLIVRSYLAQFYPDYTYDSTKVEITIGNDKFSTTGKVEKEKGWRSLYGGSLNIARKEADEGEPQEEAAALPKISVGDVFTIKDLAISNLVTAPPKRFKISELPDVMTNIHKYLKNKDLVKILKKNKGIGTEATKGYIIDELIDRGYFEIEKNLVKPSEKATFLYDVLPDEFTWPDQTALLEEKLAEIEAGELNVEDFLNEQREWIRNFVSNSSGISIKEAEKVECPKCQGALKRIKTEKGFFWGCCNYRTEGIECRASYPELDNMPDFTPPKEQLCPKCNKKVWKRTNKKTNKPYWSCWTSDNQECNSSYPDKKGTPDFEPPKEYDCSTCKEGKLGKKAGKYGDFWACKRYPECKSSFPDYRGKPDFDGKKKTAEAKKKES